MCSDVDLKLYVDSDFASRDSNRRSVSEEVVMCAGTCVSFLTRSTIGEGRGCNNFHPVWGGDGTKMAPTGDVFD